MKEFRQELLTEAQIRSICASLRVDHRLILRSTGVFDLYIAIPPRTKPVEWIERFRTVRDQLELDTTGVARPFGDVRFLTPAEIRSDSFYADLFENGDQAPEHLPAPHLQHWIELENVEKAAPGRAKRVVFYSYKGGVGRSTAMILTALVLAHQGKRVALIDFDLEAPGVGAILLPPRNRLPGDPPLSGGALQLLPEKGLVDYLVELPALREMSAAVRKGRLQDQYLVDVTPAHCRRAIHVLTAGTVDHLYPEKLAYASLEDIDRAGDAHNPLSALFFHIEELYENDLDYILIDSRTGIADIGGSLLFKYADAICAFFSGNDQNIEGLRVLARYVYERPETERPHMVWLHTMGPRLTPGSTDPQHERLKQFLHVELSKMNLSHLQPDVKKIDFLPALRHVNYMELDRTPPLVDPEVIRDYTDLAEQIIKLWPDHRQVE